jgi:hypothetical protein
MGRRDRIDAATDRVAGRGIDEAQRGAACPKRRSPGKSTTQARARERKAREPEAARICCTEAGNRGADSVTEQRWTEAERAEDREGQPCDGDMPCHQVIPYQGRTSNLGIWSPTLERQRSIHVRTRRGHTR